jgi:MFS family permease
MYLISPFTFTILTRWPRLRRWFGPLGLILTAVGFLMSSFATKVWQLIATQGVVCALGCGLLFTPTTLYLDEWFVKRKGLAYGVMWAGKSAAGVAVPFAMETCLQKFGPSVTLRAWSIATVRNFPTSVCVEILTDNSNRYCSRHRFSTSLSREFQFHNPQPSVASA